MTRLPVSQAGGRSIADGAAPANSDKKAKTSPITVFAYHERTKHHPAQYAAGPGTLDWEAQPDPFRRFAGAPLIPLPLAADKVLTPFRELWAADSSNVFPVDVRSIGALLEMSLAISAWKQYGRARWSLRCNPSSGNLHPTETYLIAVNVTGLEDGVYHYRADEHALELRCRASNDTSAVAPTVYLGFSSVHWREAWKYGERAYRYCQHDVGHAIAAVSLAARALGWPAEPRAVPDGALSRLLGLDRESDFRDVERECPDCLLALHGAPATAEELTRRAGEGQWLGRANRLDPRPMHTWPVIDEVSQTLEFSAAAEESPRHAAAPSGPVARSLSDRPAAEIFRQRRSAQAFDRHSEIDSADFFDLVDLCLPRPTQAPWNALPLVGATHLVLFVHRVRGLRPGLYAAARTEQGESLMRGEFRSEFLWQEVPRSPVAIRLRLLLPAPCERTAKRLSCQQDIAGDGCFSLAMLAEFEDHVTATPWRYRHLFWEAGTIGHVLYVAAEAAGFRGTGIGCFYDDVVHELLGLPTRKLQSLYHFTVGRAVVDQRIATLPAYRRHSAE